MLSALLQTHFTPECFGPPNNSLTSITKWCGVKPHCCVFAVWGVKTGQCHLQDRRPVELHSSKSHQREVTFWQVFFSGSARISNSSDWLPVLTALIDCSAVPGILVCVATG